MSEWVASADYASGRRSRSRSAIRVQLHITAPEHTPGQAVVKAFKHWLKEGEMPEGFSASFIEWQHPKTRHSEETDDIREAWRKFKQIPFTKIEAEREEEED